jgi:hypothetical protein
MEERRFDFRKGEIFLSSPHSVQMGSWANPAFCPLGTWDSFPGGEAVGAVKWTTHIHLAPRLRMRGSIHPFPYTAYDVLLHGAQGQLSQSGHTRLSVLMSAVP